MDDAPVAVYPNSVCHKDLALRRAHIEDLLDGVDLNDDALQLGDPTHDDMAPYMEEVERGDCE
ncbi:MAG: hypothetical protein WCV62_05360 [Candidatus Peribacteraceae bacterium]